MIQRFVSVSLEILTVFESDHTIWSKKKQQKVLKVSADFQTPDIRALLNYRTEIMIMWNNYIKKKLEEKVRKLQKVHPIKVFTVFHFLNVLFGNSFIS